MYANRKVNCREVNVEQRNSILEKELKREIGNFCIIYHKEFCDSVNGVIKSVGPYCLKMVDRDLNISYKDLTQMFVLRETGNPLKNKGS